MGNELLQVQRQLKKDEIVDKVSRMVKDHDSPVVHGMTEMANKWIDDLDNLLHELDTIEKQIADADIEKP